MRLLEGLPIVGRYRAARVASMRVQRQNTAQSVAKRWNLPYIAHAERSERQTIPIHPNDTRDIWQ